MPRWWCCSLPILVDHLGSICAFVLTALQIQTKASSVGIRARHRRRLGENGHILASFAALCFVVMAFLVPQLLHHLGFWVCLVGVLAFIVPKSFSASDGALAWVGLAIAVIETWLCLREFGDDFYYRLGLTHFSTAATVLIFFFSGLGAQGAALYAAALCAMLCACAPTGSLALGICVACLAQVMPCLLVEVLLLQQRLDAQKCEAGTASEERRAKVMATICHELKSPLHGIVGLTSSVIESEEGSVSSTQSRHLTLIQSCARRLLDMVTNVMDASVLVQDKQMRLSKDAVQLDKLVADVVTLCGHSRDRSGNSLVREKVSLINSVGPLPGIEADAHRCTQLIYNLVTNALKFTQEGSVEVSGSADEESRTVSLTVADTGIGIAAESLGRIFQPFSQEDETAERRRCDGLGLGLSICQDVVTRHGGSLTVESTKGLGSRFRVMLPYEMMRGSVADGSECGSAAAPAAGPASKEAGPAEHGLLVQREQKESPSADLTRSRSTEPRHVPPCSTGGPCDGGVDEASPSASVATSTSTAECQHRRAQHPAGGLDEGGPSAGLTRSRSTDPRHVLPCSTGDPCYSSVDEASPTTSVAASASTAECQHRRAQHPAGGLDEGGPSAGLSLGRSRSADPLLTFPCSAADLSGSGVDEVRPARGVAVLPSIAVRQHHTAQHPPRGSDEVPSVLEWCQRHEGAPTGSETSHGAAEPFGSKCTLEHSETTRCDRRSRLPLPRPHSSSNLLEPPPMTAPYARKRSPARAALAAATSSAAWPHSPPDAMATSCFFPTPGLGRAKVDLDVAHDPANPYHRSPYTSEGVAAGCDNAGGLSWNFQADLDAAHDPADPYLRSPYNSEGIAAGCDFAAGGLPWNFQVDRDAARDSADPYLRSPYTSEGIAAGCDFQGHNGGLVRQSYRIGSWGSSLRGMTGPLWTVPPDRAPLSGTGGVKADSHADSLPTQGGVGADLQVGSNHDAYQDAYHHSAGWNKDSSWQDGRSGANSGTLSARAIDFHHLNELWGPSRRDPFLRGVVSGHLPPSISATQSAHDLWELQRRAAHEELHLRHRMRDEAKQQATWSGSDGQSDSLASTSGGSHLERQRQPI